MVTGEEEGGRGEEYDHERIMMPIVAMSSGRSRIMFGLFLPTVCPMPSFTLYPIPSTIPKEDCKHVRLYFGPKIQAVILIKTLCVVTCAAMSFCDSDRHTSVRLPCPVSLPTDSVWLLME